MTGRVTVRPITLDDAEIIPDILARNHLSAWPASSWLRFWQSCPFREQFADIPLGWILQEDQRAVGVLGNVHMLYDLDGRPVKAGITTGWAVDPEYRSSSLQLMQAYFRQRNQDLWLVDSAAPPTAKLLEALKMRRIPAPDYDAPLLWPVRPRAFAAAGLRRRGVPAAGVLALPVGAAMGAVGWFRHKRALYPEQVRRVTAFDKRFDALWDRIRAGSERLRAVRTSAVLQWRFQRELADGSAAILVHGTDQMQGYAVLLRNYRDFMRLTMCDITDLQAVDDNAAVLHDLLCAAMRVARDQGADALKFAGGQGTKRDVALSLRPYSYRINCWKLFYRTARPDLSAALDSPEFWDISPFETF